MTRSVRPRYSVALNRAGQLDSIRRANAELYQRAARLRQQFTALPAARPTTPEGERDPGFSVHRPRNAAGSAEIMIYDDIGFWGVTAGDFLRELNALNVDTIDLRLNSGGGDAFDGIAIYNALRAHRAEITVYVDALAASAASVIAMAGDRVIMRRSSRMMIHEAFGGAVGDARDMRTMADTLDGLSSDIANVYAQRAGGTVDEWRERMFAETWYSASEAVAAGLADEYEDEPAAARTPARPRAQAPDPAGGAPAAQPPEVPTGPGTPPVAPVVPTPVAPWDAAFAEQFRSVLNDITHNMPDPVRTPVEPEPEPEPWALIDPALFHNALREGLPT